MISIQPIYGPQFSHSGLVRDDFRSGVCIIGKIFDCTVIMEFGVGCETRYPASTLVACAGKPILEVIDHPVTRERYGPDDVVERAFWDEEAQVSVFEIRRAA